MSDISFSKLTWENLPARTTALSAQNLNRIEKGIDDSVNGVNSNGHSIAELQTRISQIASGSPIPARTVAEMTEHDKVYLYTGSEPNYTAGNWYFYNGSAWTSGGTYGGAVTDTTLSISGTPADAKAVGQALAGKADADDLTAVQTAVAGKADADDVDARFDTVEQAIEDATFDGVDMLLTEVSDIEYGGNLVDNSSATRVPSSSVISGFTMAHPADGTYYSNPLLSTNGFLNAYPFDANGNAIEVTSSAHGTGTNFHVNYVNKVYVLTFSGLTVTLKYYGSLENYQNDRYSITETITLASAPSYWTFNGKGDDVNKGITATPSETYVPYVEPVVTYSYEYADALDEHIEEIAGSSGGDSGGTVNNGDAFESSYNLLDNSKIVWSDTGYDTLESGYYIPVTEGDVLVCSGGKTVYRFYDSSYTQVGYETAILPYAPVTVPADAVWLRVSWVNGANTDGVEMSLYTVDNATDGNEDRRDYTPTQKLKSEYVQGDIYDTAYPASLDSSILLAAKYNAVRAFNHQRNGIRVGTFNTYIVRQDKGWRVIKKELQDTSVDICAMQEVYSGQNRKVGAYLCYNNWQFNYKSEVGSWPEGSSNSGNMSKALVSAFEVVSTDYYEDSVGRDYARTVINLPQYKRNAHQFTLSVYNCHLSLTASERLTEAAEILAVIANDTSDFIILCMDSNTFTAEMDGEGHFPTWEAFRAGGFTPIHYGEYSTVTDMTDTDTSIDQIFMGANITCAGYDIVPSTDYTCMVGDTEQPVSDHCMVYADLIFDYDAVLSALT